MSGPSSKTSAATGLACSSAKRLLADRVIWQPLASLKPFPNNPRRHPEAQIRALMRGIRNGWTNPILVDEEGTVLAGHGRLEAARKLKLVSVPTITLRGLTPAEKLAIVISDNKLPEQAVWDFEVLKLHFENLIQIDFDVERTGFSTGEVDSLLDGSPKPAHHDPDDDLPGLIPDQPPVTRLGDIWLLGNHKISCGNALSEICIRDLMGSEQADLVVTDPPFNVHIVGHVRGRSKKQHREFAMASGEMSRNEFSDFLRQAISLMVYVSRDGAIHYIFMDWRHLPELEAAARPQFSEQKNLLVWNKTNAGLGTFYRSKHELIAVYKVGTAPHVNNFGLGAKGRYRTNVLDYAGANAFGANRQETFDPHPTVKPCALIADLLRDCSRRNGIVLDPFGGSGTTLIAAERTGRRSRLVELDPAYVDLTVQRWQTLTGRAAILNRTDSTFSEISIQRNLNGAGK